MVKLLVSLSLVFVSAIAFAGQGIEEVLKWSNLAGQTLKVDSRANEVAGSMVILNSMGAQVTFVFKDKSKLTLVCHNMNGADHCMQ